MYLLHHIIQHAAESHPEKPAFRFLDQTLSYAGLAERAGRLAGLLLAQGVRRGDRVGIYLHKCLESPVALYGIMQAGAAYVPLDPGAPPERVRGMIRQCGIRHLVTHPPKEKDLLAILAEDTPLEWVLGLSGAGDGRVRLTGWEALADAPVGIGQGLMEDDLAYIMYTSGSTGTPKGIMHTHRSGLSYARLARSTYGVHGGDRLSNHSPLHFDMSTFDYFTGPLAGATTVIIPEAYTRLPASLSQLMETEGLSIWYSVPFALIQLLSRGVLEARDLGALRWVLFGGEPFPPKHLRALMARWPHARFSNVYGPAEVNQCTCYHVSPAAATSDEPVPLGRVWDNAEGCVVDARDRPVAKGEPGELLVRSPTMMRGYWNRPELTARAFHSREVTPGVCDRFYRTGDLVVEGGDGLLRFLGRMDRQVKVRGHRVDLDEVEAALASHEAVEEAAAWAVPWEGGTQAVEAAVTAAAGASVDTRGLGRHLSRLLPGYALPRTLRCLASFPRTTSGKIDRRTLRQQALDTLELETTR